VRASLIAAVCTALAFAPGAPTHGQSLEAAGSNAGRDARWTHFTYQNAGMISNSTNAIFLDGAVLWFGGEAGMSAYNGAWETYATAAGAVAIQGDVVAFAKDVVSGLLWAATDQGQILQWNGAVWSLTLDLETSVHALAATAGEVWIGTDAGLFRFDGVQPALIDALGRQTIHALLRDQGVIWVGADDGLWRLRDGRWLHIGANEPLFSAGIYSLLVGPSGEIFVGTPYEFGWQTRDGAPWQSYATLDEEGAPVLVRGLGVNPRTGVLWAATDGAGVFAFDPNSGTVENYGYTGDPNLTTRFVRAVVVDGDGSVWFATPAGVFRFQAYLWHNIVIGEPNDLANQINDLLIARDGAVWAATAGGGVRRRVGSPLGETIYRAADGVDEAAYALAQDMGGAIWTGGDLGLRRFANESWDAPVAQNKLPGSSVAALLADGPRLWIGADAGLAVLDIRTLAISVEEPLTGLSVEALALDGKGRLWAGTVGNGIWLREEDATWRQFTDDPSRIDRLPGASVGVNGLVLDATTDEGIWAIVDGKRAVRWDGVRWRGLRENEPGPSDLLWALYTDPMDGALWVGSEIGVTRYDGITWTTLGIQDGLASANIYAIAGSALLGYWFGGRTGISHYRPDSTPPWLAVQLHTTAKPGGGTPTASVDEPLRLSIRAGDMQTAAEKLKVLYRQTGPDGTSEWTQLQERDPELALVKPGHYVLEFWACDASFNYSTITTLRVDMIKPPRLVWLPLLGMVEVGVRNTLTLLGTLIILGASYLAATVVSNRHRGLEAVERGYNPYISGEPVRRDDMFFGRRDLLQRIVDTLHINSIMIHGERRIGKTTLLIHLVTALREVDDEDYWFVPVYVDLEGTPQNLFFHFLIEEIAVAVEALPHADESIKAQLANLRYHTTIGNEYTDRDFTRDLSRVTTLLEAYGATHQAGKQLRLILLIDEMDVMSKYDRLVQQQLRRIFMREFSATLGAVVAGIQISKEWDRVESPWFNMFNEIALTPFTPEQAVELLVEPVRGYYRYDKEAIAFVLAEADGRPYKVQQYGLEAVNHMLAQHRRRITLADVRVAHRRLQVAERKQMLSHQGLPEGAGTTPLATVRGEGSEV
jgi:ligand-binding sensor domain-containing protein